MQEADVVVVGAGPVGLIAALRLAQSGISVTVLESGPGPSAGPRDMIYRWSTLPVLHELGVLADMQAFGVMTTQWCYHALSSGEQLVFDLDLIADDVPFPQNLHLSQQEFSAVLLRQLSRYAHAEVAWNATVVGLTQDAWGVDVMCQVADGRAAVRAGWLLGADGAHSVVRRSLGLGFGGMTWPERLVSLDIEFDFSSLGYLPATYQLDPEHGALIGQVDRNGLWRYVFAENRVKSVDDQDGERIARVLAAVLPPGTDPEAVAWATHRVHERAADRLRVDRVVLAGDAAHLTNPSGSFGLAGGLYDALAAADALRDVIADGADPFVLDRYAQDRAQFFRTVSSPLSCETMKLVFEADDPTRLDQEVEHYRHIVTNSERHRDFLLLSRDLEYLPAV